MIISRNGRITTTTEQIQHYPYPCPPSRHPGVSCEQAWELYAKATGKKIVRQEPESHAE